MAVPSVATYSAAVKVAAHTAFLALIDAGSAAAYVNVRNASDVLLATVPLTDPAGSVNGTTGQLTLTPDGRDESAAASGTAAYGELCDSDANVLLAIPAATGTAAATGFLVMNTTTIAADGPVELLSITIG